MDLYAFAHFSAISSLFRSYSTASRYVLSSAIINPLV